MAKIELAIKGYSACYIEYMCSALYRDKVILPITASGEIAKLFSWQKFSPNAYGILIIFHNTVVEYNLYTIANARYCRHGRHGIGRQCMAGKAWQARQCLPCIAWLAMSCHAIPYIP